MVNGVRADSRLVVVDADVTAVAAMVVEAEERFLKTMLRNITYRQITYWLVGIAFLLGAFIFGPGLRHDNPSIDPTILQELRTSGQMSWEAPLLELVTQPVAYVDSYNQQTQKAVVGMYSWFGIRVGQARLEGCRYGKAGNWNPNFGCFGGGSADYLF